MIVAPPSVAVLLARFGSIGPTDAIVALLTGDPALDAVAFMVTEPSDTFAPAAPPPGWVQMTSWPTGGGHTQPPVEATELMV